MTLQDLAYLNYLTALNPNAALSEALHILQNLGENIPGHLDTQEYAELDAYLDSFRNHWTSQRSIDLTFIVNPYTDLLGNLFGSAALTALFLSDTKSMAYWAMRGLMRSDWMYTRETAVLPLAMWCIYLIEQDEIEMATQLGQWLNLNTDVTSIAKSMYLNGIHHWTNYEQATVAEMDQAANLALQRGEVTNANYLTMTLQVVMISAGILSLYQMAELIDKAGRLFIRNENVMFVSIARHLEKYYVTPLQAQDQLAPATLFLRTTLFGSAVNLIVGTAQAFTIYLSGAYESTLAVIEQLEPSLGAGSVIGKIYYFLFALSQLALYEQIDSERQASYLTSIQDIQNKFARWMELAPMNNTHRWHLIEAERLRVTGEPTQAAQYYEKAIQSARENGYLRDEAIANERAADFYLGRGLKKIAALYMTEAHWVYQQWGALAKCVQLEENHPEWFKQVEPSTGLTVNGTIVGTSTRTGSRTGRGTALDMLAVAKVFESITGDIQLNELLQTVMQLTIENAGADQGVLVVRAGADWVIQAAWLADEGAVQILDRPTLDSENYPVSPEIVRYVTQTRDLMVLAEAKDSQFANTDYIQTAQPQSILSVPLVNQGQLVGALYLENNLAEGAFTPDRVDTIQLLSAQMAIALNNALLYRDLQVYQNELEVRVEKRIRDLELVSEVSRTMTTILEFNRLLTTMVERIKTSFDLYHVSVFLYYPDEQVLKLQAGSGSVGDAMLTESKAFKMSGQGLVPSAALSHKPVWVGDVTQTEDYFANPHLPETRTELAIPMLVGTKLVGVLDLQTTTLDAFNAGDVEVLTSLAEQLAISIENARLYAAQEAITDQLRSVDELKSQFLASMSHELRTPLNAILNFAEFMQLGMLGDVGDRQKDALDKVVGSGRHLLGLINDVLDIAKIESGQIDLFVEDEIELNTELATVVAAIGTMLQDKPVEFITEIAPDLPTVIGDRRRIRQILLNLLSNAAKFTAQGSIGLHVQVEADNIIFKVIDTGPGIAPEYQTSIFEAFEQTDTGRKAANSTGLGLPISLRLAEAHAGELWFESGVGVGTTFFFRLPIRASRLVALLPS